MHKLKYGNSTRTVELPQHIEWQVLNKDVPFSFPPEREVVDQAIASLIQQLKQRTEKPDDILLVVPDHTRKCNLPIMLPPLISALQTHLSAAVEILIANGSHVVQPDAVIEELLSPDIYRTVPHTQHDSKDDSQLEYLGTTQFGTEIRLNRKVMQADLVITVGGILYHYFAGFGGGPKMLLPGVAGYETIRQNHSRTIDPDTGTFHPFCSDGNITTNPVYVDLVEVMDVVKQVISLQVVLSPEQRIVYAAAGPVVETQRQLIPKVEELYSVPLSHQADVVIASAGGFPSDVNLIQSHKSLHHAFQAVKPGGVILLLAECRDGVGSSTFLPNFEYASTTDMGKALLDFFVINGQTALTLAEKAQQSHILFVSSLPTEIVNKTGMLGVKSIDEAFSNAAPLWQNAKTGYLFPNANTFIPKPLEF